MKGNTEQTGLQAHLQAGERVQGQTGQHNGSLERFHGTGMLKVPSLGIHVQQVETDDSTQLVNYGDRISI